jgi:hypothetical protein
MGHMRVQQVWLSTEGYEVAMHVVLVMAGFGAAIMEGEGLTVGYWSGMVLS